MEESLAQLFTEISKITIECPSIPPPSFKDIRTILTFDFASESSTIKTNMSSLRNLLIEKQTNLL